MDGGDTIYEMIDQDAEDSDEEYQTILDSLVSNYGAVAVNRAPADDLATALGISKEDGEGIVAYWIGTGASRTSTSS